MKPLELLTEFVLVFFLTLVVIMHGFIWGIVFEIMIQFFQYGDFTFEKLKKSILTLDPFLYMWVIVVFFPAIEVFINGIKMIIVLHKTKKKEEKDKRDNKL